MGTCLVVKDEWIIKIKNSCEGVGTYRSEFDDVISALALILEERDKAYDQYIKSGGHPVIIHTNRGGSANPAKNPILVLWSDLNAQALSYWRDLGLTPSGLKKLDEGALKPAKKDALAEAFKQFGAGL